MLRSLLLVFALCLPLFAVQSVQAEEDFGGLPPPPADGRAAVFDACIACHSTMLVAQQRLARDIWDETLEWMVEEQGMDELTDDEHQEILDYLSRYLSADTPR